MLEETPFNSDEIIYVDHSNINQYIQDRSPYLFVDKAQVIPGKSAKGEKYLANNEWFFQCYYPDNPTMPGVFQVEAIMQTASLAIYAIGEHIDFVYANKFDTDVLLPVKPGCVLYIETKIESFKRGIIKGNGCSYVVKNGMGGGIKEVTCQTNFTMLVPSEIAKNTPMKRS